MLALRQKQQELEEKQEREREEALNRKVDKARGVQPAGQRDRELGTQKTGGGDDDGDAEVATRSVVPAGGCCARVLAALLRRRQQALELRLQALLVISQLGDRIDQ